MLSIIGKLFRDAGLRDLAVESGVIAEGSINKVLDGKQYNRGVRLHKLTYEALMQLVWKGFLEWLENNHSTDLPHLDETFRVVMAMHGDTCATTLESSRNEESCQRILHLLCCYLNVLKNDSGHLAAFWMIYLEMIEILLGLIRADREGDWYLHLASIKNMIPWCFAMDKTNYYRYLPVYYAQMTQLEQTCPDLHTHFLNGGFSVQLRQANPFAKIAIDQTVEETVNKDTQTAGGTKGFSLKQSALTRYYLTAEHRAEALRQLRDLISSGQSREGLNHADLQSSRVKRDENDVKSIVDMLENNWTNPFSNQPSDLVSLSTGAAATSAITSDLLKARSKGEEAFKIHKERRASVSLSLKPWALANADGTLKKTGKATLGNHLEKEVANVDVSSGSCATIVDAMAIVQMIPVFDLYQDQSIKAAERINRGSKCGIMFNQIKPGHRIKNWKRILASTESKAKLTIFLAENWKEECRRSKLGSIILMVITGEQCFKITKDEVTEMTELRSTHEEADTRMMIHAKHAAVNFRTVVVISEDTDVFVILLSLHSQIGTKVLLRRGKKNAMRLIDISRLGTILGKDVCTALIGVHAYTGCDSVSAFAGQGKVKSIRLITKNKEYREMFCDFGKEWHVTEDMFETIQAFTCSLYCLNTSISDVNKLRYEMFRSRKGDISSGQLPPCKDALKQQTNRANYQAAIWRRSLQNSPEIPSPTNGHGWNVVEGKLGLTGAPAPDVVLELMSCKCPRRCNENCPCVVNGFSCTLACKLLDCDNMQEEDEHGEDELDSDGENSENEPADDSETEQQSNAMYDMICLDTVVAVRPNVESLRKFTSALQSASSGASKQRNKTIKA
ncbi:hypothetical protein GQR58_022123 [Nymphon striatum]|nr:hypothetical protein GQR58_022123 [Nymphon striatum]